MSKELGVTIKAETNEQLGRVKRKTGLSKSMVANIGLAYLAPRIIRGELQIVDGVIVAAPQKQQAA